MRASVRPSAGRRNPAKSGRIDKARLVAAQ
jgi:hypothetical protein